MSDGEAIAFRDVVKAYGKFRALDGLDLTVREGELYGLLGPNGSGKTTAIRLLTGLLRPTSGEVRVLGRAPASPEARPLVGYMPQETALYLDLTVRENLQLFGRLYGIPRDELERRIDELLRLVDLTRWGRAVVSNLSGGMKHRTSLAAALLPRPRLLVLDEPTVGVDPELRASFWAHFDGLRREGTTILLTTHYMDEARRCERVGLLRAGRLIAEDAPEAVMRAAGADNLEDAFLRLAGRTGGAAS
ncbi:MAG TPA: ABC transporter ATP-binding protein [Candidatus Thermoplasmatota archaeon]|nr:ABC transporter ATP-binding protein [Candidatus Thermoplasmatota archaeon]